jgi:glucokinase
MKKNVFTKDSLAIGIEIGGTKIQVGVGYSNGKLLPKGIVRKKVIRENGASGIRDDIVAMVERLLKSKHLVFSDINKIGIGFGGILDSGRGVILKSYQINGWNNFPLKDWAEIRWKKPVFIQNDASTAGLAESLHGAGRRYTRVFYMTIGSGVGGGWILNGKIDQGQGLGVAEIGHTWIPDPESGMPTELEQICSGWSIGKRAQQKASKEKSLMKQLATNVSQIDAEIVYSAATQGDKLANIILSQTCQGLGLAISNVIALLHPERVIIGGGVSFMGPLFWKQLRHEVRSRTIPFFAPSVDIVKAKLRKDVVVRGALCLE